MNDGVAYPTDAVEDGARAREEHLLRCILCGSSLLEVACERNLLSRCRDCGHIFDNPRPAWERVVAIYSRFDKYDDWLREEDARDDLWRRRLKLLRRHRSGGSLLDVGAGIGQFLHFAGEFFDVSGTEVSPTAIRIAETKYGVRLQRGTVEEIAWSRHFDVITLFHVLEHVPFPGRTLEACTALLEPGGILVVAVPNDVQSIQTRRGLLKARLGSAKHQALGRLGLSRLSLDIAEIHLSHFTQEVLAGAFERAGLRVLQRSLDPHFAARGLRKLRRYRRFYWYELLARLTGRNLYDTIWMVAGREPTAQGSGVPSSSARPSIARS